MNAHGLSSSRWRGMISGLRYSKPRRCRSATSPERLFYSTPNSDAIQAPISRVEQGETARTHATSFSCCASLRTHALPPASNRISAFRPPSANAPCQRRIVSSSSKRTRPTCSQLRPSSSNTNALARRANRCVTEPSRRQRDQRETLISRQEARANHALKRIQLVPRHRGFDRLGLSLQDG